MQLLNATDGKRVGQIKRLYRAAFPRSERKPFEVILDKTKSGQMELLAVEQDGFCGLVITILHRDIVLLDYFAITPKRRGQGIGTAVLELLRERYPDKRLLLEVEDPECPCNNREERERRLRFYLRNGMSVMPYRINLFGVEMRVLTRGGEVSFEQYHEIFREVFSPLLAKNVRLL